VIAWAQGFTNGIATIEQRTNLTDGPWLPAKNVFTVGTASTVRLPPLLCRKNGFYRILAADISNVPTGMVLIQPAHFRWVIVMARVSRISPPSYLWHVLFISSFYMDRFEVSNDLVRRVLQWGL